MFQLKLILIAVLASCCVMTNAKKMVNCYWGTWANYRPGSGKFVANDIDPNLCTHISYTFFGIEETGKFTMLDSWLDIDMDGGMIAKTMALKRVNPNLKVLAVVGGWNESVKSNKYSAMAADPARRKLFISSALEFVKKHGFDGLDLDWEYPAAGDRQNFVTLLKELYEALHPLNLELGIATGATAERAAISYDIPNIAKYVDFINVMTYDLQDGNRLSFNAPLNGQNGNNVEDSIKYWLSQGAPASKVILGLAFYGHHFRYSGQNTVGSPSAGSGSQGPFTQTPGFIGYHEICNLLKSSQYTTKFDETHGVPYSYNGNEWIGYDNPQSIEMKVELANSLNLGGVMAWSLEMDDFRGECGQSYPLLSAINKKLGNSVVGSNPRPTQKPTQNATQKPSVPIVAPPASGCSGDGLAAYAGDCTRFYKCSGGVSHIQNCPAGLHFDVALSICNWPDQANCRQ